MQGDQGSLCKAKPKQERQRLQEPVAGLENLLQAGRLACSPRPSPPVPDSAVPGTADDCLSEMARHE